METRPQSTTPTTPPRDFDALRADLAARSGTLSKRLSQVAQFFLNHPEELRHL